ncbi:MAG TPA: hypothetical protein VMR75_03920 [Candidatus Saccharimonadales bacterium]|nr:hypothetical protein [Candidatus Saccharimonadales bacterium]
MRQRGEINLHLVLTLFLGFGVVLFGVLAILAYNDNTSTQNHLSQLNAKAAAAAATKQQHIDTVANTKATEVPYQTYTADPVYGGFQLQIPKGWSIYVAKNVSSGTALEVIADPGIVVNDEGENAINTHEFELKLENASLVDVNTNYTTNLQNKTLTSRAATVAGIPATWYQGAIDNDRHTGVAVTFQDRNQVMVLTTDTMDYLSEFQTILNTAKISQ